MSWHVSSLLNGPGKPVLFSGECITSLKKSVCIDVYMVVADLRYVMDSQLRFLMMYKRRPVDVFYHIGDASWYLCRKEVKDKASCPGMFNCFDNVLLVWVPDRGSVLE